MPRRLIGTASDCRGTIESVLHDNLPLPISTSIVWETLTAQSTQFNMYHPPKDTTFSTRSKMAGLIPFSLDMDKILSRSNAQRMKTSIPKPMNLTVSTTRVPETVAEWNQALANIKRDYLNRRYRPCSTRCRELLHGAKHTVSFSVPNKSLLQALTV